MKKKRILLIAGIIAAALVVVVSIVFYRSNRCLTVTGYEVGCAVSAGDVSEGNVRIVLLSDLHAASFGKDNEKLCAAVKSQKPDLIFLAGDMTSDGKDSDEAVSALINKLSAAAPVYMSLGNSEAAGHSADEVRAVFSQAGAKVLDLEYDDIEIRGIPLRIGGIYGYCMSDKYLSSGEAKQNECDFLYDFTDTERVKLLMSHMPVAFILYGSLERWDADVVFSGHAHGGQIRLPFVGRLYAPDMGWFPDRTDGVFTSADGKRNLVVSRGLSGGDYPRFANVPEIVTVDVKTSVVS